MAKYPSQLQDKFNLRLPDGMKDAIAARAEKNGRSMNSEIVQILQDALDGSSTDVDIANIHKLSPSEIASLLKKIQADINKLQDKWVAAFAIHAFNAPADSMDSDAQ
ncbi:Arc family DNA-binding protein [Morganella morganii subsp. morganii]|uniref:Arc family DNA-binding protein n=1 Tax=Morganella morganii TaxID=582 RepID=UPI000B40B986|nr:Arc family DNA-binding protein [Morganella morganii]RNW14167.1 Arc family DNA-binding protein [Morganella morganii subsp. morganii]